MITRSPRNFGEEPIPVLFVNWFGPELGPIRERSLESIRQASGLTVEIIRESNLHQWIRHTDPLHKSFQFLSSIQKSDYLRCYLMHFYGGGYTDIKPTSSSWLPSFHRLCAEERLFGIGYPEVGRHGVARLGLNLTRRHEIHLLSPTWWRFRYLQLRYKRLIGNGAFIFRSNSDFTAQWYSRLLLAMDKYSDALELHPSRHPKERPGMHYDFGISHYPIPWGGLMANIFHPLSLRYHPYLGRDLPPPEFVGYQ